MAEGIGGPVSSPLQPAKDVNTNDHSEAMFHQLDAFKKMMAADRMGFLYKRWMEHQCSDPGRRGQWSGQPVWGEGWQEREDNDKGGLWQLKVINFGFMWDARGRLSNLATSGEALKGAGDQVIQRVQAAWTSKAGESAAGKFTEFRDAAADYTTQVRNLGAQMEGAWHATRHVIKELADFPNKSDLGGKPMMDRYGADGASDDHGNSERGNWSSRMDALNEAIVQGTYRWGPEAHEVIDPSIWSVDFSFGRVVQTPESVRQPGQVYIEADGSNMWSNEICNWLDDMAHCYFLTIGNFRRRVEETIRTVQEAWEKLNTQAGRISKDPFGKLSLGPAQGTGGDDKKKPVDNGHDRPGTGNTGTGTSSVGSTPVPPIAPPPMPPPVQPAVDDTTNPSAVDPTGVDGAPQDQGKETVTIQDGDRKISVQSPDGEGHVKITVDDGTGKPKTYDLDFSAATGADGRPQTLPAHDPSGPDTEAPPQTGPHSQTVQTNPDGTASVQPDGKAVVQAGPDGKAVVHDGNLTITAERPPGTPDQIKITVDDGTGKPTTYLVDYADPNTTVTSQPTHSGRPTPEPYPTPDSTPTGPRSAHPISFTDPATRSQPGSAASPQGPQSGFADSTGQPGFAASAPGPQSGFADSTGQSGFAGPAVWPESGFADPSDQPAFADSGTSTQSGFTEPINGESRGFTQPASGGFTDPSTPQQGGFAEPMAGDARRFAGSFTDATSGHQSGSLEPLGGESHAYAQPVTGGFADPADAQSNFAAAEPVNGGFTDPAVVQPGFTEPASSGFADQDAGFADSAPTPADGFTEPGSSGDLSFDPANPSDQFNPTDRSDGFDPTGQSDGFGPTDRSGGFASADRSGGFVPGAAQSFEASAPQSAAFASSASQSAAFESPLSESVAFESAGSGSAAPDSAAFEPVAFDPAAGMSSDFDSPTDRSGGFESTDRSGELGSTDRSDGFDSVGDQSGGFTDPAAHSGLPGPGGFEPVAQADVFDPAAAQAIDADSGDSLGSADGHEADFGSADGQEGGFGSASDHEGGFDQAATAQASGIAAGPSIGDDLFRDWSTGLSDSDIGEYQSPESAPFERSEQLSQAEAWTEPAATAAQSLGFDVVSGDDSGVDSVWSTQGDLFDDEPRDVSGEEIAPAAGEAGLATVPDNGQGQSQPASTATAGGGMSGMPMMGMGGAGGGGNTDQERGPSAWSTTGDLFDDGPDSGADRISTVLGDDDR